MDTLLVRFEPIPSDVRATAPFSISNRGAQRALRVFIDEELLRPPFYLSTGGDTLNIEPRESMEFEIEFRAGAAREFRDSVDIHSDDRQDSVMVLYVEAEAFNEVGGDDGLKIHPTEFGVVGAYPNPFNQQTRITFSVEVSSMIKLAVFDVNGREVGELVNRPLEAGQHTAVWVAEGLPAGLYLTRLEVGGRVAVCMTILLK